MYAALFAEAEGLGHVHFHVVPCPAGLVPRSQSVAIQPAGDGAKVRLAALVLTPDDSVVTRGAEMNVARDNVVFELGLFLGTLEPRRVFIVRPRDLDLRLPSDFAGVTRLDYRRSRNDQNLQAAIGPAATMIRNRIASEGPRGEWEPAPPDQAAARFWLTCGRKIPQAKDAARRLLARLPEHARRALERLAATLDEDLVVSVLQRRAPFAMRTTSMLPRVALE